jgi:hypothetical protein
LIGIELVFFHQPGEGLAHEATAMLQVPIGDRLALRVIAQPAFAVPQELLDLGLANPVVLVVVEDGNEDVEMGQQVAQAAPRGQLDAPVRAVPPGREVAVQGMPSGRHVVAARLEERTEKAFAAAAGEG